MNSVIYAEERLERWKCRIEQLEDEVAKQNGNCATGAGCGDGADNKDDGTLKLIQEELTKYQVRIKLHGMYKQKIVDSFLKSLERGKMKLDDCQKQKQQQQLLQQQHQQQEEEQGDEGSNTDSGCSEGCSEGSSDDECPTGGEEGVNNMEDDDEDEEEDLSYMIGTEEGLSIIHSVEDSDISETASEEEEEEEESVLLSTNNDKTPVHANTRTSTDKPFQQQQQTTTRRRRHLTVLISEGNFNLTQTANQRSTLQLLIDLSFPFVTIDGMDVNQRTRRNELFDISGIRGNYPQIFVSTEKIVVGAAEEEEEIVECNDVYLGGYEWFECCDLDELKEMLVLSGEKSGSDGSRSGDKEQLDGGDDAEDGCATEDAEQESMNDEQRHIVHEIAMDIDGHLKSLEEAIKIMEGRVKEFDILSTSTIDRQLMEDDDPSMDTANRLSSLARECANILENFTTKTSDMLSSSLQLQSSTIHSSDNDMSTTAAAAKDQESILKATMEQEMITEIEQKKLHLTQLEQSRDACNASIELLQNEIKSLELSME